MNYEEFISFIKTTNIKFDFNAVVEGCKIVTEKELSSIPNTDYKIIKDFFSRASSLNLIPKEYDSKVTLLMNQFVDA